MTPNWPEICPQALIEPWWEKNPDEDFKPGRLVWAFLPHTDQTPYTLEPIGRANPTDHNTANVEVKKFNIGTPPRKKDLPVSAMPLYDKEMFCVYRTKKRPAIIISKGGSFIEERLIRNKAKWRTSPTVLLAPSYGVRQGFSPELCEKIRRCEYPQFMWDNLPNETVENGSIIRFDHIQPVGRDKQSIEFTKYCLSDKAMTFIMDWIEWLLSGDLDTRTEFCETRTFLMGL